MTLNRFGYSGPIAGMLAPVASSSVVSTVTSTAQSMVLTTGSLYAFTCDVDCYIAQGAAPTAGAADGSMYVPAGVPLLIDGIAPNLALSVLRKGTTDGWASLQKLGIVE